MTAFQRFGSNIGEALGSMIEGWRHLFQRAGRALTHFTPGGKISAAESHEIALRNTGWGVLTCEVFDNDDMIVVRLEAPGMDKDNFDLQLQDNFLLVRGEKRMTSERTQGGYRISECAYGHFERAIPLPDDVDINKSRASYKRGVLRVELPKSKPVNRIRLVVR